MKGKQTNCVQLRASHTVTHKTTTPDQPKRARAHIVVHGTPTRCHTPLPAWTVHLSHADSQTFHHLMGRASQPPSPPPPPSPHFAPGVPAWCSQVRRRRAPRGRLIQRVVDGAGDERRARADVALDGEERERVLEGRFQELFELEVDRVVSKGVGLVVESGESSTLGQPEASS